MTKTEKELLLAMDRWHHERHQVHDRDERALRVSGDDRPEIGWSMPGWLKKAGRAAQGAATAVASHVAKNPKKYATAAALLAAGGALPAVLAAARKDEAKAKAPSEPEAQASEAITSEQDSVIGFRGGHLARGVRQPDPFGARYPFARHGGWGTWSKYPDIIGEDPRELRLRALKTRYEMARRRGDRKLANALGRRILKLSST